MVFGLFFFQAVGCPIGFASGGWFSDLFSDWFFGVLGFPVVFFRAVGFPVGFRIGILVVYRDSRSYRLYGTAKIITIRATERTCSRYDAG